MRIPVAALAAALVPSLASLAFLAPAAFAAPPAGSAYLTDPQSSHVEDETSRGIGEVNTIACFMAALRPDALVNAGDYIALVDKNKCDSEHSAASGGAGSDGAQAASFVTATVDSTRLSNDDPMLVKAWIDMSEDEMSQLIFAHISALEAPSDANPYGVFRLDFCGRAGGLSGCVMNGYLQGADSGLNFYETEGGGNKVVAMRLDTTGTTSGSGRMLMQGDEGGGGGGSDTEFTFAYNQSLFRRSDTNNDQCFSRDATDPETGLSVWRYGLYDANTGARVERNSGFPIEYSNGGETWHGYLGYYGLSLPPDAQAVLENGDTVNKVDYSGGNNATRTAYTVMKADGKLTRYTRHARTLREMDKIEFSTYVFNNPDQFFPGATPNTQYVLHWDESAGAFKVTAAMNCGGNGCQTQNLEVVQTVSAAYWFAQGGAQGWSNALGGEIFINLQGVSEPMDSSAVQVVYRSQDLVYPADLPPALYCVRDCPTAASLAAFFAPDSPAQAPYAAGTFSNWNPTPAGGVVSYTTNPATALLMDGSAAAVTFTNADALASRPGYQYGVRSGRLFTSLEQAECQPGSGTYCDSRVNDLDVYYQWETGPNNWNQFAGVKDDNGDFVAFDPPLQVSFDVPTGAAYGQYSGTSIILQYGGFGDLWGIPGYCVSRSTNEQVANCDENSRYVPLFVVPFDPVQGRVTAGNTTYLVKWLDREIRFAKKDLSACTAAGLTLPGNLTLPTAADLKDPSDPNSDVYIGTQPTVTDAPRVIHGEVKY